MTQGLSYVMSYLSAAISINQGQLISSVSSMLTEGMEPSEIQNGLNSMAEFIQTPSLEFLFLGTDLVFQLLTFLGVAVLIGIFLNRKAKTSMFKAVCVQLIFGIFFAVRATGVIESVAVCEIILKNSLASQIQPEKMAVQKISHRARCLKLLCQRIN